MSNFKNNPLLPTPEGFTFTEDNGASFLFDSKEQAKGASFLIEGALGPDHDATVIVRHCFFGSPDDGWCIALEYPETNLRRHTTLFLRGVRFDGGAS